MVRNQQFWTVFEWMSESEQYKRIDTMQRAANGSCIVFVHTRSPISITYSIRTAVRHTNFFFLLFFLNNLFLFSIRACMRCTNWQCLTGSARVRIYACMSVCVCMRFLCLRLHSFPRFWCMGHLGSRFIGFDVAVWAFGCTYMYYYYYLFWNFHIYRFVHILQYNSHSKANPFQQYPTIKAQTVQWAANSNNIIMYFILLLLQAKRNRNRNWETEKVREPVNRIVCTQTQTHTDYAPGRCVWRVYVYSNADNK